ncbi:hypothetical protein TNCV_4764931 [Trichonephila clavipes]|nr:hypothetical protein TNCV_4764931 [Trichonephila clavipes]
MIGLVDISLCCKQHQIVSVICYATDRICCEKLFEVAEGSNIAMWIRYYSGHGDELVTSVVELHVRILMLLKTLRVLLICSGSVLSLVRYGNSERRFQLRCCLRN